MVVFMNVKYYILVLLSIFIIFVAGCNVASNTGSVASTPSTDVKEFNTVIQNYRYNPESINVNFGDRVKINIKNIDEVKTIEKIKKKIIFFDGD